MRLLAAAPFTVFFLGVDDFAGLDFAELGPLRLPTVPDILKVPEPFPPAMARILWRRSWIARGVGASSVAAGKVLVYYYYLKAPFNLLRQVSEILATLALISEVSRILSRS